MHLVWIVISFWEKKDLDVISQANVFDMEFAIFWLFYDVVDIILNTYLLISGTLQMWEIISNNLFFMSDLGNYYLFNWEFIIYQVFL